MRKFYFIIFTFLFQLNYAQSNRNLEETKTYIVKMINDYGWIEKSNTKRLVATFEGDLIQIGTINEDYTKRLTNGSLYNFASVYKMKGPIRKPGEVGLLIIWLDYLSYQGIWKKCSLEMDIHNYEVAEQLRIAFRHLNNLLIENKSKVEQF